MKIISLDTLGLPLQTPVSIPDRGNLTFHGSLVPEVGPQFFNVYGLDSDPDTFFLVKIGDTVTSRPEVRQWFHKRGKNQNTATKFVAFEVSKLDMRNFLSSLITINTIQERAKALHHFARLSEGLVKDAVLVTSPGRTPGQHIAYIGIIPEEEYHEHYSDPGSGRLIELRQHILWSIDQIKR